MQRIASKHRRPHAAHLCGKIGEVFDIHLTPIPGSVSIASRLEAIASRLETNTNSNCSVYTTLHIYIYPLYILEVVSTK